MDQSTTPPSGRNAGKKLAFRVAKYTILAVLLFFLWGHVRDLYQSWQENKVESLRVGWVALSALAYAAGQFLFGRYWWRLLQNLGMRSRFIDTFRAYAAGTLGKYIPGKAMVVVLRTGMLPGGKEDRLTVGLSVLSETVTMMAVGATVAALSLLYSFPGGWPAWLGSLGLATGLFGLTHPWVFDRISQVVSMPFGKDRPRIPARKYRSSLLLPVAGWLMLGISAWCTGHAVGAADWTTANAMAWTGAAALATAAGFLVIIAPSGMAVRELIIIYVLTSFHEESSVVLAALLLRLTWTITEVGLAGMMFAWAWMSPVTVQQTVEKRV
ncbi:MAG: lysylphosphatidylglycerol synthase domain-containing protein [Phycisphaerae bacterium]